MNIQFVEMIPVGAPEASIALDSIPIELPQASTVANLHGGKLTEWGTTRKSPSFADLYRFLRAHHQWTLFHAVRYALWLTR